MPAGVLRFRAVPRYCGSPSLRSSQGAARNNNLIASLRGRLTASGDSCSTGLGGSAPPEPSGLAVYEPARPPQQRTREQDAWRQEGTGRTRPEHRLVLELIICEPEPLSGLVAPASTQGRIGFHGWIDLMSAIHTLCANRTHNPPASS